MVLWSSHNREKTHINYDVTLIGNSKIQKFLLFGLITYSIFCKCEPFIIFQAYIIRLHTASKFLHRDTRTFIFIIRWLNLELISMDFKYSRILKISNSIDMPND